MHDFFSRSPGLLGIDIGSSSIKLLELARTQHTLTVKNYAIVSFAEQGLEPGARREDVVADALQKALQQANTRTRNAALAIPLSESISKSITLPSQPDRKSLQDRIELAADEQLPYSLDELYWDYEVQEESHDRVNVLLVASRREPVEDRLAAAEMAGLTVRIMDVELYAQEKAHVRMNREAETSALLDIGDTHSRFSVVNQGKTTYSSVIRFGVQPLAETLRHRLPEAEKETFLDGQYSLLAEQLQRTLHSCITACPETRLNRLYLCGGGALLKGLDHALTDSLHIPVMQANPLIGMTFAPHLISAPLMAHAPRLLTACGLALRGFDA